MFQISAGNFHYYNYYFFKEFYLMILRDQLKKKVLLNNLWLDRGKCTETIAVLQIGIWPNVCIYVGNPNLGLTDTAVCEKQNWNRDKKFHQKFTCQFLYVFLSLSFKLYSYLRSTFSKIHFYKKNHIAKKVQLYGGPQW